LFQVNQRLAALANFVSSLSKSHLWHNKYRFGNDAKALDSGQKSGRRRLSKRGPAELRWLIFLAAMAAAKTILWKPIYQQP
jgi:hypothetical protein